MSSVWCFLARVECVLDIHSRVESFLKLPSYSASTQASSLTTPPMSSGSPSPPPPDYGAIDRDNCDDRPAAKKGPIEKHKYSFTRKVFGFLRAPSQPRPQIDILTTKDLEIVVHETSPNIVELVVDSYWERNRRIGVKVKVSTSVTVRSRHIDGRPVISTSATREIVRTAEAKFTKGHAQSLVWATEKATRKAAEEAHKRATVWATMAAAAKVLEEAAARDRVV